MLLKTANLINIALLLELFLMQMLYSIGGDYSPNCHIQVSKSELAIQNTPSRISLYSDTDPEAPDFAHRSYS